MHLIVCDLDQLSTVVLVGRNAAYFPIHLVCVRKFSKIKSTGLSDNLDMTCPGGVIIEADDKIIWEVDDTQVNFKNPSSALDLGLKAVRGTPEHHHCPSEFENKFLPLDHPGDMPSNLKICHQRTWM